MTKSNELSVGLDDEMRQSSTSFHESTSDVWVVFQVGLNWREMSFDFHDRIGNQRQIISQIVAVSTRWLHNCARIYADKWIFRMWFWSHHLDPPQPSFVEEQAGQQARVLLCHLYHVSSPPGSIVAPLSALFLFSLTHPSIRRRRPSRRKMWTQRWPSFQLV